ncbi:Hypothetical protein ETEE_2575 [Edwardsiella anguillarum ET080813]|uniref:Uncharacterized protein n=1 Tax=Edwardsiella anguillarum ET080813 TaxID=667120 RepID=A0A076LQT4_9GAMM|nr:Hypothetical protein ETEE_2575 [Edwardsiella anguillarum ET080813]
MKKLRPEPPRIIEIEKSFIVAAKKDFSTMNAKTLLLNYR